jgi:hypothetical protein
MRFLFLVFIIGSFLQFGFCQTGTNNSNLNILLRNEASFGLVIHTEGSGLFFRRGKHVTGTRKRVMEGELVSMHHPKEIKVSRSDNSKGFYFGKLNMLYFLRGGVGFQQVLFRKGEGRGAEIRFSVTGGGSVCLAKPIYLDIYGADQKTVSTERYDPTIHNSTNIYGRSSFFTGVRNTQFYPGFYGKFALSCELGDYSDRLRILEVGAVADFFPMPVPIMANLNPQYFFTNLYISYSFGRKWI